jgi:cobalt/nickel transport system ATP-binding protein
MIRVEALSHSYEDGRATLKNLSFEVARGEKVVLLGANGTGKTTLLKILDGLLFPCTGSYSYRANVVTKDSLGESDFHRRFRREIVLLFQNADAMIFNPTVREEIAFGPSQLGLDDVGGRVMRWAGLLGLVPHLERPPFQLSSGEKKRVCLASLLVLEPQVLLLDEPTANLDPGTSGWLVDFLQELDVTMLVATHNLSSAAELGSRTLLLSEDHELIYDGESEALLGNTQKLREANMLHTHRHRHGGIEHDHFHAHEWE